MFSFLKKVPKINNDIQIELGATYTDKITGHTGIATGVCVYITGCSQALISSKEKKDGSEGRQTWYDIQRLEKQENMPVVLLENGATPGCDISAPIR
jgi:hypothetical protein